MSLVDWPRLESAMRIDIWVRPDYILVEVYRIGGVDISQYPTWDGVIAEYGPYLSKHPTFVRFGII